MNKKIGFISLLAMASVIGWHCPCGSAVERWIIPLLFYWSVPWFFFISGVFWGRSLTQKPLLLLFQSKIRSLLIPYVCWCVIGALFTGVSNCGGIGEIFAFSMRAINPTGNGPLWYLRALMFFVILTGSLWILLRKCKYIWAVCLIFMALVTLSNKHFILISTGSSPVWFSAGMVMSRYVVSEPQMTKCKRNVCLYGGLCMCILFKAVYFILGYDFSHAGGNVWANLSHVGFMIFLWFSLDSVVEKLWRMPLLGNWCALTAMVYFMHYPLLRPVVDWLCEGNCLSRDGVFIMSCIVSPFMLLVCARLIQIYFPRVYNILSGGR